MIITDIGEFSEKQIKNMENAYRGQVKTVLDLSTKDACDWDKVEILITYGGQVDSDFLDRCSNLKWIQVFQSGVEMVPLNEVKKRNIVLTNILGIHGIPMSEYVISTIMYFTRDFPKYLQNKKKHLWDREELVGEASGKIVGIIGAGTIGQEIAERLEFLGMKVYGLNTSGTLKPHFEKMYRMDQKKELLKECDFVILLLPLTEDTKDFMDVNEFKAMKEDAYLINIGRGPLLNEAAFISAMKNKQIKGAALDVFNEEPLPECSPLWDLENVLITPHVAAKSVKFLDRCIDKFTINLENYFNGKPLNNIIDLVRGY